VKRIATTIGVACLLLLAAAAAAYAFASIPRPAPRTEDLPRVVAHLYASAITTGIQSVTATAPLAPAGSASTSPTANPPSNGTKNHASGGSPTPSKPPAAAAQPDEHAAPHSGSEHEVVTPQVHESDDTRPRTNGDRLKRDGAHRN
jgi:hypothetical protein